MCNKGTYVCGNATCNMLVNTYVNSCENVRALFEIYMECANDNDETQPLKKNIHKFWIAAKKMNKRTRINLYRKTTLKRLQTQK